MLFLKYMKVIRFLRLDPEFHIMVGILPGIPGGLLGSYVCKFRLLPLLIRQKKEITLIFKDSQNIRISISYLKCN